MGILSVVATPIGNLGDVTIRALETLRAADIILCEDTRQTKKLLDRHQVLGKKLMTYNAKTSGMSVEKIGNWLLEGKHLALVSDAGTPGISDPGALLVGELRAREDAEHLSIVTIPGPSAVIAALSISGLPTNGFHFLGFLPHKKGRETLFKEIAVSKRTTVFYESPHRLLKTLASLAKLIPDRVGAIARELTKVHEELHTGTMLELSRYYIAHGDKVRGECVILVSPAK